MNRDRPTTNPDFARLLSAQTISSFGSNFGALGLTALLFLHVSALEMGVLAMAQGAPVLLFALVAGVWVDRLSRRPIMIAADLGRFVILGTVPVAAWFGWLRIEHLYVAAFLTGGLGLGFDLAYRAYLPALVERSKLVDANAKLQVAEAAAEVGSPAAGGAIVQVASGPVAVGVDALTFLASASFVLLIRKHEPQAEVSGSGSVIAEAKEGLVALWRDRSLRALAAADGTFRFFGGFFAALYVIFLIRTLGFSPFVTGATIGAGGIGSLAGAFLTRTFVVRFGLGGTILVSRIIQSFFIVLVPLASGPQEVALAMILVSQVCGDPFWATYEIGVVSARQLLTPPRLLGRVTSGMHFLRAGLEPLGALTAGILAESLGVRLTLWIAVAGLIAGIGWLVFSPVRSIRSTDEAVPA